MQVYHDWVNLPVKTHIFIINIPNILKPINYSIFSLFEVILTSFFFHFFSIEIIHFRCLLCTTITIQNLAILSEPLLFIASFHFLTVTLYFFLMYIPSVHCMQMFNVFLNSCPNINNQAVPLDIYCVNVCTLSRCPNTITFCIPYYNSSMFSPTDLLFSDHSMFRSPQLSHILVDLCIEIFLYPMPLINYSITTH